MRTRRKRISACNARQRSGLLPGVGHFSVRPVFKLGRSKFETVRPTYKMARFNRKTVWSNVNLVWIKSDFGLIVRLGRAERETGTPGNLEQFTVTGRVSSQVAATKSGESLWQR